MIAITRTVGEEIRDCELTFRQRSPIDVERARRQHRAYCERLRARGAEVVTLPAPPGHPDAVFVEDIAVVLNEVALITHPGAASRRAEVAGIAEALAPHRPIIRSGASGTLDGGDVLRVGRSLLVGRSRRTSRDGIAGFRARVEPLGYAVREVGVHGCLHLKTACTHVGDGMLLVNRGWIDGAALDDFDRIDVPPGEPWAANTLRIGDTILLPAGFPETERRLRDAGRTVETIDLSEFLKAEGGPTCLSVVFAPGPGHARGGSR